MQSLLDADVSEAGMVLVEKLKEAYDLSTIAFKLASIIASEHSVKGKDNIGKSLDDISKLHKTAKEDRSGGRGRGRGRGRNSGGGRGGRRDGRRDGGNRSGGRREGGSRGGRSEGGSRGGRSERRGSRS